MWFRASASVGRGGGGNPLTSMCAVIGLPIILNADMDYILIVPGDGSAANRPVGYGGKGGTGKRSFPRSFQNCCWTGSVVFDMRGGVGKGVLIDHPSGILPVRATACQKEGVW